MSMKYFDSDKVKIFPCTYRGTDSNAAVYDPEARLLSEYNLTHLPARLPGRTSYVIQYINGKLLCNMAGYLVEVELQATDNLSLCLFYLVDNTQTPKQILCPADGDAGEITDGARIAVDLNGKCMCLAYTTDNSGFSTENSKISMATLSVWKNSQPTADWLNPLIESVKGSSLVSASLSSDKRSVTVSTTATRNPQVYTAVQVQHNGATQGELTAQSQTSTLTLNTSGELIKGGVVNGAAVIQSVGLGDNLEVRDNKLHAANSVYGLALDKATDQISLVEDGKDKSIKLPSYSLEKDEETLSIQLLKDGEVIASVKDAAGIDADGAIAFSTATVNNETVANANTNKNLDLKYQLTQEINGALQLKWDDGILVNSIDPIEGKLSLRQDSDTGAINLCWPNNSKTLSTVTLQPFKISGTTCTGIYPWAANLSSSISIPSNVKTIAANAFENCTWITEVLFPSSLQTIGQYAFAGCTNLKAVNLANTVNLLLINYGAFQNCQSLQEVNLPARSTINSGAFIDCNNIKKLVVRLDNLQCFTSAQRAKLEEVQLLRDTTTVALEDEAFKNCTQLRAISFPDNLKTIGSRAFYNCINLTNIALPNSVSGIGERAFFGCGNLATLTLPDTDWNITGEVQFTVDWAAFLGCNSLSTVYWKVHFYEDSNSSAYSSSTSRSLLRRVFFADIPQSQLANPKSYLEAPPICWINSYYSDITSSTVKLYATQYFSFIYDQTWKEYRLQSSSY